VHLFSGTLLCEGYKSSRFPLHERAKQRINCWKLRICLKTEQVAMMYEMLWSRGWTRSSVPEIWLLLVGLQVLGRWLDSIILWDVKQWRDLLGTCFLLVTLWPWRWRQYVFFETWVNIRPDCAYHIPDNRKPTLLLLCWYLRVSLREWWFFPTM
jgi:hypothetical protein